MRTGEVLLVAAGRHLAQPDQHGVAPGAGAGLAPHPGGDEPCHQVGVPAPATHEVPNGVAPGSGPEAGMAVDGSAGPGVPVEVEGVGQGETHPVPQLGGPVCRVLPVADAADTVPRPQDVAAPEVAVRDVTGVELAQPLTRLTAYLRCCLTEPVGRPAA